MQEDGGANQSALLSAVRGEYAQPGAGLQESASTGEVEGGGWPLRRGLERASWSWGELVKAGRQQRVEGRRK